MGGELQIDFIRYLQFEKRYSSHTLTAYQHDLEQFAQYLSAEFNITDLSLTTHFQVRSWLAGLKEGKMSARALNCKMSSLNSYFKYLQKHGLASKNPVKQLHAQRLPARLPTYIKEQEAEVLLEELQFGEGFEGFTERLICEILYATGVRRAELLQLKENDIEWSLKQVRVLGKGNKERLIPVSGAMLDSLRDYLAAKRELDMCDEIFLLNLPTGKPLYAGYIYRTVKKHLASATTLQKKSPHVLRHTFATHLLNNGANIQAIKDLLGHSSLAATQVYTHNNISKLKEIHKQSHPRG